MEKRIDIWGRLTILAWLLVLVIGGLGLLSYQSIQRDLDKSRLESARLKSQVGAINAVARENAQFLQSAVVIAESLAPFCEAQRMSQESGLQTICANQSLFTGIDETAIVLVAETRAASFRASGAFEQAVSAYGDALMALPRTEEDYAIAPDEYKLRQMLLLEGQAYSHYRLGNLAAARTAIDQATALGADSVTATSAFVYSTEMKIRCSQDEQGTDFAGLFARYRQDLDAALAADQAATGRNEMYHSFWLEFREDDLAYFSSDDELAIICGLA